MKILNLTVNPLMPVPFTPPPMPREPANLSQTYSVGFAAQFENEVDALALVQ